MYKLETLLLLIDKLLNNTTRMTERKPIWEDSNWLSNYKTLCTISQGKEQLTTILLLEMKLECIVYNLHHISTYSIITTVQNKQLVSLSEYFTFKFWEEIFFFLYHDLESIYTVMCVSLNIGEISELSHYVVKFTNT